MGVSLYEDLYVLTWSYEYPLTRLRPVYTGILGFHLNRPRPQVGRDRLSLIQYPIHCSEARPEG
jgi:hypothetical protein